MYYLIFTDIPTDSCVFIKNSNGVKLRNRPCNSSQLNICYTVLNGIVSSFFQKQNCDTGIAGRVYRDASPVVIMVILIVSGGGVKHLHSNVLPKQEK